MADLYSWGSNNNGQLGNGTTVSFSSPQLVSSGWKGTPNSFSSAAGHALGIKENGSLWSWGRNNRDQLGLGASSVARLEPTQVGTATDWAKVSAAWEHSVALKSDGSLWGWGTGSNVLGAVGTAQVSSPIVLMPGAWLDISAGFDMVLAIKADGTLWGTGRNSNGQLGVGSTSYKTAFTQENGSATNWSRLSALGYSAEVSFAQKTGGLLLRAGSSFLAGVTGAAQTTAFVASAVGPWSQVSTSGGHSVGIKTDGTLWAWGFNGSGRLGDGTTTNRTLPVQVGTATNWVNSSAGYDNSAAVNSLGELYLWGSNFNGQIGDATVIDRLTPTLVLTGVSSAVSSDNTSYAFTAGAAPASAFWSNFVSSREIL